tara:strand:+ start:1092 stop:1232 length:141 start_codon:yes stop_codon:yes gene_type:complete
LSNLLLEGRLSTVTCSDRELVKGVGVVGLIPERMNIVVVAFVLRVQ